MRVFSSTGSPAFFQAAKPPSISQTGSSPICWATSVASAERQAPLQKKTNSLPGEKTSLYYGLSGSIQSSSMPRGQ